MVGLLAAVLSIAVLAGSAHAQCPVGTHLVGIYGASGQCVPGTPGDGFADGQAYGLGQGGSPAATDFQLSAQGFNSSLSPMLVALIPVFVVILAIWLGPALVKRLLNTAASG